jgi:hydroxymethylbilane synthase
LEIRIATRKSELALWQARHVASKLDELPQVSQVTLVPLSTRGDEILDKSLQKIGGKGLFIKELEVAMQAQEADIAVHSMKDVPAEMPPGFCIAAVLERASPADALVSATACGLSELPEGAIIGSSSLRRQAQLLALRPDVTVNPLRGNVATRLGKLDNGDYQAIILASAGLQRLGQQSRISEEFDPRQMLPAAAQGVIGIECVESRDELRQLLATLEHADTKLTTTAERAVALTLGANCQSPVASFATIADRTLTIDALVASTDGRRIIREQSAGPADDAEQIGTRVAERLLEQGAKEILYEAQS